MPTPIFPGHFQPWHNGHTMVVKGMVRAHGSAVIVICGAQPSHEKSGGGRMCHDATCDPFTLEERREIVSAALLDADILDATIVTVKDGPSDGGWIQEVLEAAGHPAEPVIWSGNAVVKELAQKKGIAVQNISPVPGINSAEIRQWISAGKKDDWSKKVSESVADIIHRVMRR